jgi:hypothetical protein
MNRTLCLTIFAMIAVPFGSGCLVVSEDTLDDIKDDITNEIPQSKNTLQINAIADGSGKTHVVACVADPVVCRNADGPFSVTLGSSAPVDMPFVVDYAEGDGSKVGRFQGDAIGDAPDSLLTVKRKGDATTESMVALPLPAIITAPAEGAMFSAATDQIKLTWDSTGLKDQMEWSATVECGMAPVKPVEVSPTTIPDTGEAVIDPAKLNLPAGESCLVNLHLTRLRDGTIEKAFSGNGLITVKQTRSVKINVAP